MREREREKPPPQTKHPPPSAVRQQQKHRQQQQRHERGTSAATVRDHRISARSHTAKGKTEPADYISSLDQRELPCSEPLRSCPYIPVLYAYTHIYIHRTVQSQRAESTTKAPWRTPGGRVSGQTELQNCVWSSVGSTAESVAIVCEPVELSSQTSLKAKLLRDVRPLATK